MRLLSLPPPVRTLAELMEGMPGRARALGEVGWLVATLLGLAWLEAALRAFGWGPRDVELAVQVAAFGIVVWAYALVRPWRAFREGRARRAVALSLVLAPLALLSALGPVLRAAPPPPRIGVALADAPHPGEASRRLAQVKAVTPGSAADGRLEPGDRVVAVNGRPLDARAPADDLSARAADPTQLPAGEAVFRIVRRGVERDVPILLGEVTPPFGLREAFRATIVRNLALLGVLWALLRADRQGLSALGLERRHLGRELRATLPAFLTLLFAHFVISLLVTLVAAAFTGELLEAEIGQRREVASTLITEHLTTTLPLIVLASMTEEVVFRGFMLPRLRVVSGGWVAALLVGALLFGLGHVYEGALATVQTAGVGLVLGLIFVWRRQLLACVLSHVGFNALALTLGLIAIKMGWLERAGEILGR